MKAFKLFVVLIILAGFSCGSCSKDDESKSDKVEFTFNGETYSQTSHPLFIQAYYDGSFLQIESIANAVYLYLEFDINSTSTITKSDYNSAITINGNNIGDYYAYNGDEDGETKYSISVTEFGNRVEGTFSGVVRGGNSGDDIQSINGSFSLPITIE